MTGNVNIAGWLSQRAALAGATEAIVEHGLGSNLSRRTFHQLDAKSNQLARGLAQKGITAGMRVALMQPPGVDLFAFTFALFKLGAVPVLIDPGMGTRGLGKCLANAAPAAFVGVGRAQWARWLLQWARDSCRIFVNTGFIGSPGTSRFSIERLGSHGPPVLSPAAPDDIAAILFTSGSTGPAKGAVYTHGMFQEQVRVLREVFGIAEGEVDLCTFPLFALFAPALGMKAIVPRMNPTRPAKADPRKLLRDIEAFGVTNIFGSPALLDTLSRFGQRTGVKLPTVRRVISAGAPVSAAVIERVVAMLQPGVQVFTPYGATEALPVAVIGSNEILGDTRVKTEQGAGVCVGRPVGRVEVRILPISDEPFESLPAAQPNGQIGEIAVRGPVVSRRYWNRPEADAMHKVGDWHRMGDVGYFDTVGRLWFCGRKSQRVVLDDDVTLFTIPCEAIFNTHPAVKRSALVKSRGRAVVCVVLDRAANAPRVIDELREYRSRYAPARHINDFLVYPGSFPVDIRHNAKIAREQLASWTDRRLR